MMRIKNIFLLILWCMYFMLSLWHRKSLEVSFVDVGQGDTILVKTPNNKYIVIDGGPDLTSIYFLGKNIRNSTLIDYVVLTHPHADHINGLYYFVDKSKVGKVFINDVGYSNSAWDLFVEKCKFSWSCINVGLKNHLSFIIDSINFELFAPKCDGPVKNINNCSIISLIRYNGVSFLLMGDSEKEEELWLLSTYGNFVHNVTVLKAGHHCSKTASGEAFIEYTKPSLVICSVGRNNKFGHPHSEAIETFVSNNIKIFRTDQHGSITISVLLDGRITVSIDRTYPP